MEYKKQPMMEYKKQPMMEYQKQPMMEYQKQPMIDSLGLLTFLPQSTVHNLCIS